MLLMPPRRLLLGLLILFFLQSGLVGAAVVTAPEPLLAGVTDILSQLNRQPDRRIAGEPIFMPEELQRFYAARGFEPIWSTADRPGRERIQSFLRQIASPQPYGLCPDNDHSVFFRTLLEHFTLVEDDSSRPQLRWNAWYDVLLTDALFQYARHLIEGRVQPDAVQPGWNIHTQTVDLVALVTATVQEADFNLLLHDAQPTHKDYRTLQQARERYLKIQSFGGWPTIPAGGILSVGMADARVARLRARLLLSGDMAQLPDGDLRLDADDVKALKRFQRRHGLAADGRLGRETLAALNVPVAERIRQIELNLQRWRWLPPDLGKKYLQVNIADFSASIVDDGRTVLSMPVVVGNRYRKTPVFSARMTYIEFAPYWYVPTTILEQDKLPRIKADPEYIDRHHYEIVGWDKQTTIDPQNIDWPTVDGESFPGLLRQKPGPWNPLGRAKFILPNDYAIYLHDTDQLQLFNHRNRQFSSGCIRVKQPEELARYLLVDQGWDAEQVTAAMAAATPQQCFLRRPLPVHILYWTAWVDDTGQVNFRDDVYGRDRDLQRVLEQGGRDCQSPRPAVARK